MGPLAALDAFYLDHRRCGELDAGVDGAVVWIACDCGARIARRADDGDVLTSTVESPHHPGMDRRRFLLSSLAGALAAPFGVEAQQAGKVARIGVLLFGTPATDPNLASFVASLRDLGYVEGRNLALETRSAEGRLERVRDLAIQVVGLTPDVIVVLGGDMVPFVKDATSTIPIVMLHSQDPVEAGAVTSFARPGANLTGVAFVSSETAGKRLQFRRRTSSAVSGGSHSAPARWRRP